MPIYKVVEHYPDARVSRILFVKAPNSKKARTSPHEYLLRAGRYEVDEGGAAVTESCRRTKSVLRGGLEDACEALKMLSGALEYAIDSGGVNRTSGRAMVRNARKVRRRLEREIKP
jgi:hypothetical protein